MTDSCLVEIDIFTKKMLHELTNNILICLLFLYHLIGRKSCAPCDSPCILMFRKNVTFFKVNKSQNRVRKGGFQKQL
jgi:hypothetical protein